MTISLYNWGIERDTIDVKNEATSMSLQVPVQSKKKQQKNQENFFYTRLFRYVNLADTKK